MNVIKKLNGIIGVIDTPFTNNNEIDHYSLRRYIHNAISGGVVGFLVPAKAAEVDKLSGNEREGMVATVLEEVAGEVPIIGGASASSQGKCLEYARSLKEAGCDGILVSIPYERRDKFEQNIYEIANLQPGFLMIQDWDFQGYGIPLEVIVDLFNEIECFKCLKVEVVPSGVKYSAVLEATEGRLHVSGGWAGSQMIEALDRGVNAFMPTILLGVYAKIYNLHHSGERERAKKLFYDLLPIIAFSHQHLDISIHFNKRLYFKQRIFSTPLVRDPILTFDREHEKIADEMIEKAITLLKDMGKY